jgi:hypothetical protein
MTKTLQTGIHRDVDFETYLAWDAVSNSRLGLANRSAAHYRAGFQGEPTQPMRLGSFIHCGCLEVRKLMSRYVFMPDYSKFEENVTGNGERSFSKATKFVKTKEEAFRQLNADKEIIDEADYHKLLGIAQSLQDNAEVVRLLKRGESEVSLAWVDDATGLQCKARCDWLHIADDHAVILDLKTTQDAKRFPESMLKYGYHRQAALYQRGVQILTGKPATVYMLAVETTAPFACRVAPVDADAIAIGAAEVDELLATVAESVATDTWPSYANPESWRLPEWYTRKLSTEPVELVMEDGEVVVV